MIRKKLIITVLLASMLLPMAVKLFAIEPGDPAPKIRVSVWLRNKPYDFLKKWRADQSDSFLVVCFWATWSKTVNNLFRFLDNEHNVFKSDNVQFIAISKEKRRVVERYLKRTNKVDFSVAVDRDAKTYRDFMHNTEGVPVFFIFGKNKKLIWKGSPFEFDRVLSRVVTGTYDPEIEKKVSDLRKDLQRSIEFMNFSRQSEISQEILEIDPLDQIAINNIADDYIREGKIDESIEFMFKRIKMASHNKYISRSLYFNVLTILRGMNDEKGKKYLLRLTNQYYSAFKNDPDSLNAFVGSIIQALPMEIIPFIRMYEIADYVIKTHKEKNPDDIALLGVYYRTIAKIYYMLGFFDKALESQNLSAKYLKQAKREKLYEGVNFTADFYKSIIETHDQLKGKITTEENK